MRKKNNLMWKYAFIIIAFAFLSCENSNSTQNNISTKVISNPKSAQGTDKSIDMPVVEFPEMEHDFGKMIKGEKVTYDFKLKNTGNADLLISKVRASCGCTASEYPVDPIKPGEEKKIKVVFDSETKIGFQNKRITVFTNAEPSLYTLRIKADVIKPGQ